MNDRLIEEIVAELKPLLAGRLWGKVFQLSAMSIAVDFRTGDGRYLFISVEPSQPRLYMIRRTVRELEKTSNAPMPFSLVLRKSLGGAQLTSLTKDEGERVVRFNFAVRDATGEEHTAPLVAQLTGRTSNLFLLDEHGRIKDSLRPARGAGQETGEVYSAPARFIASSSLPKASAASRKEWTFERAGFNSPSEALDEHFSRLERERAFDARAAAAAARIRQETSKLRRLRDNLSRDLAAHGDADEHRRAGELLLANIGSAVRSGGSVRLTDFYAEGAPTIELEIDERRSLQEEAAHRFARYGKAKRAAQEISERLKTVETELAALDARRVELEGIIAARDAGALAEFNDEKNRVDSPKASRGAKKGEGRGRHKADAQSLRGIRTYRSSDGYEILVGRGSRENDQLTFRVARSYDTWLHAADYPGSHVVVRHKGRDENVPHRTIVEAAQLAAHFSQARRDAKVAVNYTQRKFVSKPKGAAPGLVYLSSFRTLLVEPREGLERA
jgi:predicted ribosome quality control (RQC) complex YloA/Tae2 family protein